MDEAAERMAAADDTAPTSQEPETLRGVTRRHHDRHRRKYNRARRYSTAMKYLFARWPWKWDKRLNCPVWVRRDY